MKNQKNMQFPYLFPDISPNNSLNHRAWMVEARTESQRKLKLNLVEWEVEAVCVDMS